MSTAEAVEEAVPVPVRGKKKLILIIAAVAVLVLAAGGGTAAYLMNTSAPEKVAGAEDGEDGEVADDEGHADLDPADPDDEDAALADASDEVDAPVLAERRADAKSPPLFVPLDPFTVNLADRNADRYAQVGITLEIDNAKTGDRVKAFMPAIRNNILMAIADRTAEELLGREGKALLAERVRRETSRAMGYEVGDEVAAVRGTPRPAPASIALPVTAVHFSNFIVQ